MEFDLTEISYLSWFEYANFYESWKEKKKEKDSWLQFLMSH